MKLNNKKKILIIGASAAQVSLIRKVRSEGYIALVASCDGDYPGFREADEKIFIDLMNKERLVEEVSKHNIHAVVTDRSELCLPVASFVANRLGLPGIPLPIADIFVNKNQIRQHSLERGIPNPKHHVVREKGDLYDAASEFGFPLILKPTDNNGSRGVVILHGEDDCNMAFSTASRFTYTGELIAEKVIDGFEVAVESIVYNGQVINLVIGQTEYFNNADLFLPSNRTFPAPLTQDLQSELYQYNKQLYSSLGDFFAMAHAEYMISAVDGTPYLIDAHLRGGGACIASHIVPLVTGVDLYGLYISWATGQETRLPENIESECVAAYKCFLLPPGKLYDSFEPSSLDSVAGVKYYNLDPLAKGTEIELSRDKGARKGPIVIAANTHSDLERLKRTIEDTVSIRVQTPGGLVGPIW